RGPRRCRPATGSPGPGVRPCSRLLVARNRPPHCRDIRDGERRARLDCLMTHATAPPRADRPDDAARARSRLEQAVLEAVAYADVFDFALTPAEVHRDLPIPATPEEVSAALATSPLLRRVLRRVDGL